VNTTKSEHGFCTVLFDIDGTLIDSNDAHAEAWVRAFAEVGIPVDPKQVRRAIGMGGDKLMPSVGGVEEDSPAGRSVSNRRSAIFMTELLPHLRAFPDAHRLIATLKARGFTLVAASSAKQDELTRLLAIAGADGLFDGAMSSDDADSSKPDPDIVNAALQRAKASPEEAVMIGDTPYDIAAAARAGVRTIGLRCGGWSDEELAGAMAIYDGPWDLLRQLETSPLGVRG